MTAGEIAPGGERDALDVTARHLILFGSERAADGRLDTHQQVAADQKPDLELVGSIATPAVREVKAARPSKLRFLARMSSASSEDLDRRSAPRPAARLEAAGGAAHRHYFARVARS
jgi:hypothetical protein